MHGNNLHDLSLLKPCLTKAIREPVGRDILRWIRGNGVHE